MAMPSDVGLLTGKGKAARGRLQMLAFSTHHGMLDHGDDGAVTPLGSHILRRLPPVVGPVGVGTGLQIRGYWGGGMRWI